MQQPWSATRIAQEQPPVIQFDLVHCDCIQEMGMGQLTVARQLGISYLVTLHDGWWLSPNQFLTSPSGRFVDPGDLVGHHDAPEQVLAGAAA